MIDWRWDQGRIIYFQYDVLKEIARTLIGYNGKNINDTTIAAEFKSDLIKNTGLPFLPLNYKVNRNYSRVFQCAMLATTKDKGVLICSDICNELAKPVSAFEWADDYFMAIVNRFRFPFPAFTEYESVSERVYPFCAIIKFLISRLFSGKEASASLEDITKYIIGNSCTGLEDIEFYKNLKPSSHSLTDDAMRQLREMTVFIGQLSFLKILDKKLYLDVLSENDAKIILDTLINPVLTEPKSDKVEEFLSLTSLKHHIVLSSHNASSGLLTQLPNLRDIEFVEGKRKKAYHMRIERSPLLRRLYIQLHPNPICDACKLNVKDKYPWTSYMLDLHHLLPLSSVIKTLDSGTSINDMVGLCPSCHRAIHAYYEKWLKYNNQDDFQSKTEAMEVYLNAIKEIA